MHGNNARRLQRCTDINAQNRGVSHLRAHESDMGSARQEWFGVHVIDINTASGEKLWIFFA